MKYREALVYGALLLLGVVQVVLFRRLAGLDETLRSRSAGYEALDRRLMSMRKAVEGLAEAARAERRPEAKPESPNPGNPAAVASATSPQPAKPAEPPPASEPEEAEEERLEREGDEPKPCTSFHSMISRSLSGSPSPMPSNLPMT
jgi:hypothetical protein